MKNILFVLVCCVALVGCDSNNSEVKSEVKKDTESKELESDSLPTSNYEMHIDHSCSFDVDLIDTTVYSFASDIDADKALNRIMKLTGLPANFELKSASVPNACAVVKCDDYGDCKRYILYSQEFMENIKSETRTNYAELGVLAHEIGHHLSGHTLTNSGSRYDTELEADKFAGFILYKLGATLKESKQSYSNLPTYGSSTHPPRSARIVAVTSGWYDAKRNGESINKSTTKSSNSSKSSSSTTSISSRNTKVGLVVRIGNLEVMTKDVCRKKLSDLAYYSDYGNKNGHVLLSDGWRFPTIDELRILYKYKDKIGGFKTADVRDEYTNFSSYSSYFSSSEGLYGSSFLVKRFIDGEETNGTYGSPSPTSYYWVRAVRDIY